MTPDELEAWVSKSKPIPTVGMGAMGIFRRKPPSESRRKPLTFNQEAARRASIERDLAEQKLRAKEKARLRRAGKKQV
jgi:hypothetical protein